MPGPYSKPQGLSIMGGGGSGRSKKNMTKKPLRRGPSGGLKKTLLPLWQDRDVKKRGTKLNP